MVLFIEQPVERAADLSGGRFVVVGNSADDQQNWIQCVYYESLRNLLNVAWLGSSG